MALCYTPWTADQVKSLNAYQRAELFHPFTCSRRGPGRVEHILVATTDGWTCPVCIAAGKPYDQNWCHDFMANWAWGWARDILKPQEQKMSALELARKIKQEHLDLIRRSEQQEREMNVDLRRVCNEFDGVGRLTVSPVGLQGNDNEVSILWCGELVLTAAVKSGKNAFWVYWLMDHARHHQAQILETTPALEKAVAEIMVKYV